jgi:Pao retrotransposon peptidase
MTVSTKNGKAIANMKNDMASTFAMRWAKDNDTWSFILKNTEHKNTKSGFLSQLMEIFDPLKLMVLFTLKGKLIYRQVSTEAKGSWDKVL